MYRWLWTLLGFGRDTALSCSDCHWFEPGLRIQTVDHSNRPLAQVEGCQVEWLLIGCAGGYQLSTWGHSWRCCGGRRCRGHWQGWAGSCSCCRHGTPVDRFRGQSGHRDVSARPCSQVSLFRMLSNSWWWRSWHDRRAAGQLMTRRCWPLGQLSLLMRIRPGTH